MIVIGADTHKRTHTCGAVLATSGQLAGAKTAAAREVGFRELLAWGRELDAERIWALEDCRHVSGSLERFLVAAGERVVRVPPKLMGQSRRGERAAGKSDPIDALAVAGAALREGPESLPAAHAKFARLAGVAPVPASSGQRSRHRLDRGGNRQLNCALHRIAVTQGRIHPPARQFLAEKQAEGKSRMKALRCLKRHLARRVWRLLVSSETDMSMTTVDSQRDVLAPQVAAAA